ncbi:MAG: GNAT family N-acetyltransferase [Thermoplasmata archaeon]|jgi:ribosomal protein S18 acetylase RimI-like enzyme
MTEGGSPLVFRQIRRADLPTFVEVIRLGIGKLEHSTGLDEGAEAMFQSLSRWSIWLLFGLLQLIGRPFVRVWVGLEGPRVVGTGTLLMLPKAGYVAGMATHPEFRGRGVASRILALEQAETVRRGRDWIVLDVESENETAIRVYRRAGYREVGRYTWYSRLGIPPTSTPSPSPAASKGELKEFIPKLDASRGADLRTSLPADPRMLSHNELLVRGPRAKNQTWIRATADATPSSVRAYFMPRTRMGVYFPTTGTPEPSADELTALFASPTEWLRPQDPKRCLAVLAEPVGTAGAALEKMGFVAVVSSTLMVRPTLP